MYYSLLQYFLNMFLNVLDKKIVFLELPSTQFVHKIFVITNNLWILGNAFFRLFQVAIFIQKILIFSPDKIQVIQTRVSFQLSGKKYFSQYEGKYPFILAQHCLTTTRSVPTSVTILFRNQTLAYSDLGLFYTVRRPHEKDQHTQLRRVPYHDKRVQRILRVLGSTITGRHHDDQPTSAHNVRGSMLQHNGY